MKLLKRGEKEKIAENSKIVSQLIHGERDAVVIKMEIGITSDLVKFTVIVGENCE